MPSSEALTEAIRAIRDIASDGIETFAIEPAVVASFHARTAAANFIAV